MDKIFAKDSLPYKIALGFGAFFAAVFALSSLSVAASAIFRDRAIVIGLLLLVLAAALAYASYYFGKKLYNSIRTTSPKTQTFTN